MKFTTITQPKKRVWAIDFAMFNDNIMFIDFISPITGEVITGITYNLNTDTYSYVPPFEPVELEVYSNGKITMPMVEFFGNIAVLARIKQLIIKGIDNKDLVAGWELDKPRTAEDYMDIAIDYDRYKSVMYLGIDTITQAVNREQFNFKELETSEFKDLCKFMSWICAGDKIPF